MSLPYTLPLYDPQADLQTAGGKGTSLAKLVNAGLPVPGGFHVTTEAYRHFVAANELQDGIRAALQRADVTEPATLEAAAEKIGQLFAEAPIPEGIAQAIREAYRSLSNEGARVAVRSSATAEDLPGASFAGQQETFLNLSGAEQVLEAVKKCWASLWTARAIGYRARQGIGAEGMALAVVVQEMVFAEAAGILFTANPLNGKRDQAVINAAWGLGEAIVGGAVTPDTITFDKPGGRILQRQTAEKRIMTVRTPSGTQEQPVPSHLQNEPVLSDEQAAALVRYGMQIEALYGMPMDIEWALGPEGNFAILQARPVTALPEARIEWAPPDPKGVYMRGSVVDLMPEPLSPLFITLGIPSMIRQMQPLGKRMTGSEPVLAKDYFASINAYAYMNSYLPPRGWLWILFHMLPAYPRMLRGLVPLWRDELHPEYQAFVAGLDDKTPSAMAPDELWRVSQQIVEAAMYYVCALTFATMGASAGSEMLLTRVYEKIARQEGDPPASVLLMGWDNIPMRAEKSLYDLAAWCRARPALAEYVLQTSAEQLAARLQENLAPEGITAEDWQGLRQGFHQHLDRFGHSLFQMDFAADLPLDHPEPMLENIKMYLRGEGANPHERQRASEARRIETGKAILARLKGLRRWAFLKALKAGQAMAEVREDALAEIGLGYPKLRAMLREMGRRFAAAGAIEQADDIFWLEKEEIDSRLAGNEDDLRGRVAERKKYQDRLKRETPPAMMPVKERIMGIKTDVFIPHAAEGQTGDRLKGTPASPGIVTSPARVLRGPEDFEQMRPGEALVASTTTPAWTPLFAMASAVVTDIGGPLSHGSIVAREYGIPAVMGTGVATRRIRSGQTITVDGGAGVVSLESGEAGKTGQPAPPSEWRRPNPKATYARGSLAEHLPNPVTPLFATLGLEIANQATDRLWERVLGTNKSKMFSDGFYHAINGYVYGGFQMSAREVWLISRVMIRQTAGMLRGSVARWQTGRQEFARVVEAWETKEIKSLSPAKLLEGVRAVFGAAADYYNVIQSTLPAATSSEILFSRFYNLLIKGAGDPEARTLLFGFETMPVRAEKSLYDIAAWLRGNAALADYALRTPTETLAADLQQEAPGAALPTDDWNAWRARLDEHFEKYGRTAYEFDFSSPTPAEAPGPMLDAIKLFLENRGTNPYERLQAAVERREQATRAILKRLGWPRKGWFQRLLKWAQEAGPLREDSIFDMGMGHPLIRRMLGELGRRFATGGAIETAGEIYWLEEDEVADLAARLENGETLPNLAGRIPSRKADWQAALQAAPPIMLPERSRWSKVIQGGAAKEKDGKMVLVGVGTSSGQVRATACVLLGTEDFSKLKPGDVLVATTTTPAWTPLFAMAAAVVTDIGGPLSHSSIVAREYGIPAVMAARNATRLIKSGQVITVDGSAGTVTLE